MVMTVSARGKVTMPKFIRQTLGIEPGTKVDFRRTADGAVMIVLVDQTPKIGRFAEFRGQAGEGPSTDAIMMLTRGDPDNHGSAS